MELQTVLRNCLVLEHNLPEEVLGKEVSAVVQDTRLIKKEALFIAIKGASFDGHDAAGEMMAKGALAVVVEKKPQDVALPYILVKSTQKAMAQIASAFYEAPSTAFKLVGVTGTNGKTTTTHLIDKIVEHCGDRSALVGTMYNKIDQTIIPTANTTPDSLTLQSLFAEMKDSQVDVCSMEVSSHGLELGRVWGTDFDIAVFTNLTQDHLDFHGTMENYFLAKSLLFSQLGNTYSALEGKAAVINCDDSHGRQLIELTAANVLTYGCHGEGDIQASNIQVTSQGTNFTLTVLEKEFQVTSALIGDFNVYNLLAAIGATFAAGYPLEKIIDAILVLRGVKGRFELIPSKEGVTAIVDYAHTPDGLENVLTTIQKFAEKKIYCVVGCGGDRDRTKRSIMADIAMKYADVPVFTSDNPRTEDPDQILYDMTHHLEGETFIQEVDRKKAIQKAVALANPGDVVLVAGKGHEDYQIIGKEKHHFDDAEILRESTTLTKGAIV